HPNQMAKFVLSSMRAVAAGRLRLATVRRPTIGIGMWSAPPHTFINQLLSAQELRGRGEIYPQYWTEVACCGCRSMRSPENRCGSCGCTWGLGGRRLMSLVPLLLLVGLTSLCSLLAYLHLLLPVCPLPSHLSPEHEILALSTKKSVKSFAIFRKLLLDTKYFTQPEHIANEVSAYFSSVSSAFCGGSGYGAGRNPEPLTYMAVVPVDEDEVVRIIPRLKSKQSTDKWCLSELLK
ncbi:hypothetical protein J6590_107880, partial [Homalodisca vitripennis]